MNNRYRNPWFRSCNTPRSEFYENDAPCVAEYRGVKIYKLWNQAYDFVLGDCAITQRSGITEHKREIHHLLDGETPCDTLIYQHLTANGHTPISYDQYTARWHASNLNTVEATTATT